MPETPQETKSTRSAVKNTILDLSSLDDALFEEKSRSKGLPRVRHFWISSISLVFLVALAAGAFFSIQHISKPAETYQYVPVLQGNLSLTVSATGAVQADTYSADFSNAGKISQISVKLYDHVKKGQPLAQLTKPDNSSETLKAPHSGVITAINNNVGDTVSPSVSGSFMQLIDLSVLHIQANVNEADIGNVVAAETVQFTVSAYGTQAFAGIVTAVSPIGKADSSVVTYPVLLNVDMRTVAGVALLPNMTAHVTISTARRTNVQLISTKAVTFARQASLQGLITFKQVTTALSQAQQLLTTLKSTGKVAANAHPTLAYVLERANNQWLVKPVVLGVTDGSVYEVVAGTLSTGERIVIAL